MKTVHSLQYKIRVLRECGETLNDTDGFRKKGSDQCKSEVLRCGMYFSTREHYQTVYEELLMNKLVNTLY